MSRLGWEPDLEQRVVDRRREQQGAGTVVRCDQYGHFANPYWRVVVLWDSGRLEHDIEVSSLGLETAADQDQ
jgi:hypothetical protein